MARAGLLLLPLLLCFGPETAGSIDPAVLRVIVDHVNLHGGVVPRQSSFAISLHHRTAGTSPQLGRYLPKHQLGRMKASLSRRGGLYNLPWGHFVAAWPRHMVTPRGDYTEHSEWHLLSGPSSLVARLKARTYGQNSCLILFSFNSPCSTKRLRQAGQIVPMTGAAFCPLDNNYKAFVFRSVFPYDLTPEVTRPALLRAWHWLGDVPLLCCDDSCRDCAGEDAPNCPNPCWPGRGRQWSRAGNCVGLALPLASFPAQGALAR